MFPCHLYLLYSFSASLWLYMDITSVGNKHYIFSRWSPEHKNTSWNMHIYLAKSSRFESTGFASVMTDDVGCSRRHQCPQCEPSMFHIPFLSENRGCIGNGEQYTDAVQTLWLSVAKLDRGSSLEQSRRFIYLNGLLILVWAVVHLCAMLT